MVFEFEVEPSELENYLAASAGLRPALAEIDGFLSVERFASETCPGRFVAIGYFETEEAVGQWRNLPAHRKAQRQGREQFFTRYRLVMANVLRDYSHCERGSAPPDSRTVFEGSTGDV